ncbi:uncharacterized protein DS421_6g189180 [Arachis hypogaea]|nr:uncharacterized protein DS421_6g189180 [Arachis hypogaea]
MGVKRPNWHKSWRLTPRRVSARKMLHCSAQAHTKWARKWIFMSFTHFCKP